MVGEPDSLRVQATASPSAGIQSSPRGYSKFLGRWPHGSGPRHGARDDSNAAAVGRGDEHSRLIDANGRGISGEREDFNRRRRTLAQSRAHAGGREFDSLGPSNVFILRSNDGEEGGIANRGVVMPSLTRSQRCVPKMFMLIHVQMLKIRTRRRREQALDYRGSWDSLPRR